MIAIIFGVAAVGKTTIGKLLAKDLGWPFYEGDRFHPAANIKKMHHGTPLTDKDRQPWLKSLRGLIERKLAANQNAVLACSALKRKYRDFLGMNRQVRFVFLRGDRERVAEQLRRRRGHFFDPRLLDSQFAELEEPGPGENAIVIEIGRQPEALVAEIKEKLSAAKRASRKRKNYPRN